MNKLFDDVLVNQFEKELILFLLEKMRHQDITEERASFIAKFILLNIPEHIDIKKFIRVLPEINEKFIELTDLVNKYISEYEKIYTIASIQEAFKTTRFDAPKKELLKYFHKNTTF